MSKLSNIVIVTALTLGLPGGCQDITIESVEELERLAYAEQSPFTSTVEQAGIEFELIYQPPQLLLVHEYKYLERLIAEGKPEADIQAQRQNLAAYTQSFEHLIQYKLIITPTDASDLVYAQLEKGFDVYSAWLQRLLFGLQEEMQLKLADGTQVPLASYQMDRNYGVSPSRTFILSFPAHFEGKDLLQEKSFRVELAEFGLGTGRVQFKQELPYPRIQLTGV